MSNTVKYEVDKEIKRIARAEKARHKDEDRANRKATRTFLRGIRLEPRDELR